ncbi:ABC transporter substrate-binding protein [Glaciimonas sp. Gout2]|uniref:MlaC/ttg2D family ABC transporter substrate-binding protein n=1 Tax=unclassified Glaciimonas TaxID=2644401 RepID=UPI002AB3A757|nr:MULTISPECIES: ABC transporter substrate-binding protein [unclassified Glaciimonas]MDY7546577.1 ABC transporter substrate-binding protein [Glaciimonas sp. CA11.2]MEB0011703.1 ABC transporter substrate-binding protein [Glaciimonas sp. Cout2]MEB0080741.1 ABC transporter substrate-binding protein [Glaciimonas sp. Gout2]
MNTIKKYLALAMTLGAMTLAGSAFAQEAPDALVQRISHEVIDTAKADKSIQGGNQQRILSLVEEKIIPYVDFDRMTSLAAGRFWREATPDQKKQLTAQFRSLLIFTYSGALAQVRDQKIDFKPMRGSPTDTDVEVRSQVIQPRGEPIQLNYRMEKLADGWKIYDVNVLGAWLVESYKGTFASEIGRSGMDGLIKMLTDKNKSLAAKNSK